MGVTVRFARVSDDVGPKYFLRGRSAECLLWLRRPPPPSLRRSVALAWRASSNNLFLSARPHVHEFSAWTSAPFWCGRRVQAENVQRHGPARLGTSRSLPFWSFFGFGRVWGKNLSGGVCRVAHAVPQTDFGKSGLPFQIRTQVWMTTHLRGLY
jgi:hypothetical protein